MSLPGQVRVADYVMDRVARVGVRHVFLIPGGGSMYLVDALGRHSELTHVAMLHEQGAAIAAEAYGQFTGNLGVVLVTTGPGGTNAMTGVAAAYLDSTPMLVISGQVKTADSAIGRGVRQLGFQEIDVVSMARPITKMAVRIEKPDDVPQVLEEAISVAQSGRPGPVWVDLPLDVQSSMIVEPLSVRVQQHAKPALDMTAVYKIVQALQESEKPVLLVGNGVRLAHAEAELNALIELTHIPTLLTWKALDLLPFDDPLNAGRPGGIATRYANYAHQFCDTYLAIGARLDMGQTGYRPDNIAPNAKRFIVDIDEHELEKLTVSNSTLIRADAKEFLGALLEVAREEKWVKKRGWSAQIAQWKIEFPLSTEIPKSDQLTTYDVLDALSEVMQEGDVFVPGSSGACSEVSMQAFRNKRGQRVFNSEGLGPMGFGIPAPIGAWLADQTKRYFSVDGDGGFHMNTQELEVAKRLGASICWIVLDNNGYGSIKVSQDNYFEGRRVASDLKSGLSLPPIAAIARSFGIEARVSRTRENLKESLASFQEAGRPMVIVSIVDEKAGTVLRVKTRSDSSGILKTTGLEELT
jgi:acetolactate synthase-1/2/3 large subunit